MSTRQKEKFESLLYFHFPFYHQSDYSFLQINTQNSPSNQDIWVSECKNFFGCEFIACGITKEDSLNSLYGEMTVYLSNLIPEFLSTLSTKNDGNMQESTESSTEMFPTCTNERKKPMKEEPTSFSCTTTQSKQPNSTNTNFISLLYEYCQKNHVDHPKFEFTEICSNTQNSKLFGCILRMDNREFVIEPTFSKKTFAKEQACKYVMQNVLNTAI